MSERKNRRRKRVSAHCPTCQHLLWRQNSQRYYLFASGINQIQQLTGFSRKKASIFANQNPVFIDRRRWLEEFFCIEHGSIWLLLTQDSDHNVRATIPDDRVWEQTTGTVDPRKPNPSVSEYTFRSSRGTIVKSGERELSNAWLSCQQLPCF